MQADVVLYLNQKLFIQFTEREALQQLINAACLPGIYKRVIGMPDIHTGFGLPIGGVMAVDASSGVVSAGAVGMDINCGVRLLRTAIPAEEVDRNTLLRILEAIKKRVPLGIGKKGRRKSLVKEHFNSIIEQGAPYIISLGFGRPEDLPAIEEEGSFPGGNIQALSSTAVSRGDQLSTIGGGNHFIEIGYIAAIYDRETARSFGLKEKMLSVLIHTGSRGFGHQICTDYSKIMRSKAGKFGLELPSPGLAAAPIDSSEGRNYLAAMACAANFAFANRQMITQEVREAFEEVFGGRDTEYDLGVVYDLAHNIAKFERIEGRNLLIHRKGAARALPPNHPSNPEVFKRTGHPVLIPGSMGSASYVVVGTEKAKETFYSVNHGAGRTLSRREAQRVITVSDFKQEMEGIIVLGGKENSFLDEAPQAYKDIDAVVDTLAEIGITRKVARLVPLAVLKGEGSEG